MKAIAAMDSNRVIGYKGNIPWHLSADFKWFKSKTIGHNLVMGRTTHQSVGSLPGRYTYVLTSHCFAHCRCSWPNGQECTLEEILAKDKEYDGKIIWVCGGAKTYQSLLPNCDELFMTHVLGEYDGDTFMPEFESMFPNSEIVKETKDFWIVRYWK